MYIMTQTRAQGPCFWHIRTSTPSFQHLSDGHHLHRQLKYPLLKLSPWILPYPTLTNSPIKTSFPLLTLYDLIRSPSLSIQPSVYLPSFLFSSFFISIHPSIHSTSIVHYARVCKVGYHQSLDHLGTPKTEVWFLKVLVARFNMRCKEALAFAPLDVFTKTERCISGRNMWSGNCLQGQRPLRICGDSQDGCCMLPSLNLLQHYFSPDSNPQAVLKDL